MEEILQGTKRRTVTIRIHKLCRKVSHGESSLEFLPLLATTSLFYQTEKMNVWAAVQYNVPSDAFSLWSAGGALTKMKPSTERQLWSLPQSITDPLLSKLAPQNNICQFLVVLINKKPWATCLFCYVHTFYFYDEYQGTVYRSCTDLGQLQSCMGCLFSLTSSISCQSQQYLTLWSLVLWAHVSSSAHQRSEDGTKG